MDDRGSWKVGLITLLALLGAAVMVIFLVPSIRTAVTGGHWSFYLVFSDVNGLQPAEKIELAGVEVGTVDSVRLVTRAGTPEAALVQASLASRGLPAPTLPFGLVKVTMGPNSRNELYRYYHYEVGASSLIGTTHQITIDPAPAPAGRNSEAEVVQANDVVMGEAAASLSDLAAPARSMLGAVTDLTNKMRDLVADPRMKGEILASLGQVHQAAANLNAVTVRANGLAARADAQLSTSLPHVGQALNNVDATTANFRTASERVPGMITDIQGSLKTVQGNFVTASVQAREAVSNINTTTAEVNRFVTKSGTLQQLQDTMTNFRQSSDHLNTILTNMQQLTTNPEFQQDLPAIVHNLRDASAQLAPTIQQAQTTLKTFQDLGQTVNSTVGGISGRLPGHNGGEKTPAPPRPAIGVSEGVGFLYSQQTTSRFSHRGIVDPEYTLSYGPNQYYLGLYDLGGQNRLTAEIGRRLTGGPTSGSILRYGVYRSFAGVGLDYILNPRVGLYGTAYDPNRPTVDLEGVFSLNPNYAIWGGIDEVNRQPRTVLGFRIKTGK